MSNNIDNEQINCLRQMLLQLEAFNDKPILTFTELCHKFKDQYGIDLQSFYEATGSSSISGLLRHVGDVILVSFDEDDRRYTVTLMKNSSY